ncbi:MAG TPA: hypothetical protein V6D25_13265 [Leptolyngbyaceae cyanobacterium]
MSKKRPRKQRRFQVIYRLEDVEIRVEKPCSFSWGEMVGDRYVRNCPLCHLNVFDFAGLSPDEILALINQYEGKLCAQFYARADGTMTVEACDQQGDHPLIRGGLEISQSVNDG